MDGALLMVRVKLVPGTRAVTIQVNWFVLQVTESADPKEESS